MKFNFTKVLNGNNPKTFKVFLDLDDNIFTIIEEEILHGGVTQVVNRFSGNLDCSLYHDKERQIKKFHHVECRGMMYELGEAFKDN